MADLSDNQSALTVKVVGADSSNVEQTPIQSTSAGSFHVNLRNVSGTEIGTTTNPVTVDGTISVTANPLLYDMFSVALPLNMATASTDNPLILLKNPSGSSKRIMIWQLYAGVSITNVQATFCIYANPTISVAGTSQTPVKRKIGQTYSASATVETLPTVSSLGTRVNIFTFGQNTSSDSMIDDFSITLEPNNTILITGDPSSNNRSADLTLIWTEVAI